MCERRTIPTILIAQAYRKVNIFCRYCGRRGAYFASGTASRFQLAEEVPILGEETIVSSYGHLSFLPMTNDNILLFDNIRDDLILLGSKQ